MPQPNIESKLAPADIEALDRFVLDARHTIADTQKFCAEQGWPSRSPGAWSAYKRRAESREVERSIQTGKALSDQIKSLKAGKSDEMLKALLDLLGSIALRLAANGAADPTQLKTAQRLTQLVLDSEGMKGKAALEKEKLKHKERELSVMEQKFMRETTALYIEWRKNDLANQIADDTSLTQPQKIEALGKAMFGDLWE